MKIFVVTASLSLLLGLASMNAVTAETPYLPYTLEVTPTLKKSFQTSDFVEVRALIGTAPTLRVGGTYRVVGVCRQEAINHGLLYVGNTAEAGSAAIVPLAGSSLYKQCASGLTEFDVTFTLRRPGVLHITIYDQENTNRDDNVYAGILLGGVAASR